MPYDEFLADRVRRYYQDEGVKTEEKKMMGGLCFMVDGKMCTGIVANKLMARIGPEAYETALKKKGATHMDFTGRAMKGYVFVKEGGIDKENDLKYWMDLAMAFNPLAKASKKKKKK